MTTETPEAPAPETPVTPPAPQSLMEAPNTPTLTENLDTGLVNAPSSDTTEPSPWYLAEGVVGQGDKPEYLQDKYNSVSDQAKAYVELSTRFGAHKGAPTEYDLKFIEESGVAIDPNQPQLQEFMKLAKDQNVNQQLFQDAVSQYIALEKSRIPTPEEERAKLGEEGAQEMDAIRQWAVNTLPSDEAAAICYAATTAAFVRGMTKLRHSSQQSVVPTDPKMIPVQQQVGSVAQLKQEMADNYEKYCADEPYRKDHYKRMTIAVNREDAKPKI